MNLVNRGSSISTGGKGIHDRADGDFYATQSKTVQALLDTFELKGSILEPACVDENTEYFNGKEWVKISKYVEGDKVLQYVNGIAELTKPIGFIKEKADKFFEFENHLINMKLSPEHLVYFYDYKDRLKCEPMKEIYLKHYNDRNGFRGKIPTSFKYGGNLRIDEWLLRLAVVVIADGRVRSNRNYCEVKLKKERKQTRLEYLLTQANIPYEIRFEDECKNYLFYSPHAIKDFPYEWYNLTLECKQVIAEEVFFFWMGI